MQEFDRKMIEDRKRFRQFLIDEGVSDKVLAEHDKRSRDIDLGLLSARSCWHSISPAQARALAIVGTGRCLFRHPGQRNFYDAFGDPHAETKVCSIKTARALCAHELLAPDGGALDPEAKFVITERGAFVLRFGYHRKDWYSGD